MLLKHSLPPACFALGEELCTMIWGEDVVEFDVSAYIVAVGDILENSMLCSDNGFVLGFRLVNLRCVSCWSCLCSRWVLWRRLVIQSFHRRWDKYHCKITTFTSTPQINKETWYALIVYCLFYKISALMSSLFVIWKRMEWYTDTNQQGQKFAVEPGIYLNTISFISRCCSNILFLLLALL